MPIALAYFAVVQNLNCPDVGGLEGKETLVVTYKEDTIQIIKTDSGRARCLGCGCSCCRCRKGSDEDTSEEHGEALLEVLCQVAIALR